MSMPRRSAVVTGSAGFIGSHLTRALAEAGVHVRGLDMRRGASAVIADVRRPIAPELMRGADTVVHLAALAGVQPSVRDPQTYTETNVRGTGHVLAAAAAAGVRRVVVASSSSVYGDCPSPAAEDRTLDPMSPYALTKCCAETLAASYADRLEIVVVRPFTVYGPGQREDMLIARLLAGERCRLWHFVRDFTHVDDVVAGLVACIDVPKRRRVDVFNLGSGRPVSAVELLDAVAEVSGRPPVTEFAGVRSMEPRQTWADPRQARERLGMPEPAPLLDGLAQQAAALAEVAA